MLLSAHQELLSRLLPRQLRQKRKRLRMKSSKRMAQKTNPRRQVRKWERMNSWLTVRGFNITWRSELKTMLLTIRIWYYRFQCYLWYLEQEGPTRGAFG